MTFSDYVNVLYRLGISFINFCDYWEGTWFFGACTICICSLLFITYIIKGVGKCD